MNCLAKNALMISTSWFSSWLVIRQSISAQCRLGYLHCLLFFRYRWIDRFFPPITSNSTMIWGGRKWTARISTRYGMGISYGSLLDSEGVEIDLGLWMREYVCKVFLMSWILWWSSSQLADFDLNLQWESFFAGANVIIRAKLGTVEYGRSEAAVLILLVVFCKSCVLIFWEGFQDIWVAESNLVAAVVIMLKRIISHF